MSLHPITAEVITCPGRLGDDSFRALEISIESLVTPFHMVLALPAVSCHALARQVEPAELYDVIAGAINGAGVGVEVRG